MELQPFSLQKDTKIEIFGREMTHVPLQTTSFLAYFLDSFGFSPPWERPEFVKKSHFLKGKKRRVRFLPSCADCAPMGGDPAVKLRDASKKVSFSGRNHTRRKDVNLKKTTIILPFLVPPDDESSLVRELRIWPLLLVEDLLF